MTTIDAIQATGEKTVRPMRRVQALLGFLHKMEVDAIFKQQPFETIDGNDPVELWRHASVKRLGLSPLVHEGMEPLPDGLSGICEKIKDRPTYKKYYETVDDYSFALAPIESLLTPQWFVDAEYVDEIMSGLHKDMSLEEQLFFAMSEGKLTEPIITGNQVSFLSPRLDLYADQIPMVREVGQGEFEIFVRAASRPNYVQVAKIGERLLLTNGVHKVSALCRMGLRKVPCVFRTVHNLEAAGLNPKATTLFSDPIFNSDKPALVKYFWDSELATPLNMRSTYQILQVSVGVGVLRVPALPKL
ncbi:MAG: hypothetical protein ACREI9_03150 [Nitrospiraceae bacterium]